MFSDGTYIIRVKSLKLIYLSSPSPLCSEGYFCGQVNQSVRYVHRRLKLVMLNVPTTLVRSHWFLGLKVRMKELKGMNLLCTGTIAV